MSTPTIERLIVVAVLLICLSPCIPVVAKARNRRQEKRILSRDTRRPPKRAPRRFRAGPMPAHGKCLLLPGEAEVFRMITDAEYAPDPKSFLWIPRALKAGHKTRRP